MQHPDKYNLLGINISATDYDKGTDFIIHFAKIRKSSCISALAVHGLVVGSQDSSFKAILNDFDMLVPDGQPVRVGLNLLYKINLSDRVYGPNLMLNVCESAAIENIPIYLYGSYANVVEDLARNLTKKYSKLRIAGQEPSLFKPLTKREHFELAQRINKSGAGIIFLGLGCPLQEKFAYSLKSHINAVQICVGAAFDFHSGNKKMAPEWMQKKGLEWLFRFSQEPGRLYKRYILYNALFLIKLSQQIIYSIRSQKPNHKVSPKLRQD
jgi:N-acetylglucosaminyldiphosphoundecaprenol N-acetyl-beta-D-mannosaminyltransferase